MAYLLFLDSCESYDEFRQKYSTVLRKMIYIALNLDELLFDCYHGISLKVTSSIGSLKPQHTIVWKSKKTNIQKPQFETLIRISFKLFEHLLLFRTWCLRSSFFYHVLGRTSLLHFTRQNCLLNVWNHSTLHHYHPHEYSLVTRTDFTDLHRQRLAFPQPFFAEAIITVTYIITQWLKPFT